MMLCVLNLPPSWTNVAYQDLQQQEDQGLPYQQIQDSKIQQNLFPTKKTIYIIEFANDNYPHFVKQMCIM